MVNLEDSDDYARLRKLAQEAERLEKKTEEVHKALRGEVARMIRQARTTEGPRGRIAATVRVAPWSREHCHRLAGEVDDQGNPFSC